MGNLNTISRMTARELPEKFLVAFSLPENSEISSHGAEAVEKKWVHPTFSLTNGSSTLSRGRRGPEAAGNLRRTMLKLAVVCVSGRFGGKPWTQAEHAAIRARQMKSRILQRNVTDSAFFPSVSVMVM